MSRVKWGLEERYQKAPKFEVYSVRRIGRK
jgi:hypothetical protein